MRLPTSVFYGEPGTSRLKSDARHYTYELYSHICDRHYLVTVSVVALLWHANESRYVVARNVIPYGATGDRGIQRCQTVLVAEGVVRLRLLEEAAVAPVGEGSAPTDLPPVRPPEYSAPPPPAGRPGDPQQMPIRCNTGGTLAKPAASAERLVLG